ncbi:LytTR family transcriptional regulator [Allocoprobacillus halotolerans]|uniref:LytTR family transcriptional regulator n=1 Tax=Allocoprobacillus halotolerans TaxID=2944914 RepID=A0ABY5HYM8_9FIRM|nr:LytTR family DNA-binding domain-containing protein [Allocoprobacillus halotolerans]UTY38154.1 LytTR family transcriptional regulator [Allocoprobacillus halotolerans]
MKIRIEEDCGMNHHQMKLVIHPQIRHIAEKVIETMSASLESIHGYDEYNNMYFIPIVSIVYIETIDHKLYAYTKNQVYYLHFYSLKELMRKKFLPQFCQINAQTLVNTDYVCAYRIDENSRRKIILENGEILIVNRSYKNRFENVMNIKNKVVK